MVYPPSLQSAQQTEQAGIAPIPLKLDAMSSDVLPNRMSPIQSDSLHGGTGATGGIRRFRLAKLIEDIDFPRRTQFSGISVAVFRIDSSSIMVDIVRVS